MGEKLRIEERVQLVFMFGRKHGTTHAPVTENFNGKHLGNKPVSPTTVTTNRSGGEVSKNDHSYHRILLNLINYFLWEHFKSVV